MNRKPLHKNSLTALHHRLYQQGLRYVLSQDECGVTIYQGETALSVELIHTNEAHKWLDGWIAGSREAMKARQQANQMLLQCREELEACPSFVIYCSGMMYHVFLEDKHRPRDEWQKLNLEGLPAMSSGKAIEVLSGRYKKFSVSLLSL